MRRINTPTLLVQRKAENDLREEREHAHTHTPTCIDTGDVLKVKANMLVAQSCPILCDPRDCSLQAPLSMGSLQARILEWVAMPFYRGSS